MNTSESPTPDPLIGRVIAGRYEIISKLGQGGMGAVYAARQAPLGRVVALKVLLSELSHDVIAAQRFEKEALAISKLSHPNIVTIFDFGVAEDRSKYIAMERLDGLTLRQVLRAESRISPRRTVRVLMYAARALSEAHRIGIVHRDLKPDNIMFVAAAGEHDFVKVLDFGVAKFRDGLTGPSSNLTDANIVMGTPKYMAPEQINGVTDDPRSDIYALGAMAFEMLTGQVPFDGESAIQIMLHHVHDPRPSVHEAMPYNQASADLDRFVQRLMARQPADRPDSASRLLEELEELPEYTGPRSRLVTIPGIFPAVNIPLPPGSPAHVALPPTPRPAEPGTPSAPRDSLHATLVDVPAASQPLPRAPDHDTLEPARPQVSPDAPTEGAALLPARTVIDMPAVRTPVDPTPVSAAPVATVGRTTTAPGDPALINAAVAAAARVTRARRGVRAHLHHLVHSAAMVGTGAVLFGGGALGWAVSALTDRPVAQDPPALSMRQPESHDHVDDVEPTRATEPPVAPTPRVTLKVFTSPPGAEVFEGMRLLGLSPGSFAVEQGLDPRLITIRFAGKSDVDRVVVPDRDVLLMVSADPAEPAPKPVRHTRVRRTASKSLEDHAVPRFVRR